MAIGPWGVTAETLPGALTSYIQQRDAGVSGVPQPTRVKPSNLIDPTAQVQAPMEQSVGPADRPAVGDYGMGRLKNEIDAAGDTPSVSRETLGQMDAEAKKRGDIQHRVASDYEATQAQLTGLAGSQELLTKIANEAFSSAQQKIVKASKLAQYPSLSGDEIDRLEATANDDTGKYTAEQKRTAQLSLKRAGSIDPSRLMTSSTSNRILAVIANALGAAGTGLSGGRNPNFGMQLVNDAIERDIMAQKSQFDQAEKSYTRERTLYSDLRSQFDNETQAIAAQRAMLLDMASVQAKKYGAEDLALQTSMEAEKWRVQVAQTEKSDRINAKMKAASIAEAQQRGALENKKLDIVADKNDQVAMTIPGGAVPIAGKKVPKMGVSSPPFKMMDAYNSTSALLDDLIATRGEFGPEVLNRYGVRDARSLHALIRAQVRKLTNTGAHLSEDEVKMLDALVSSDPTDTGFILETLKATRANIRRSMEGSLKTYNLRLEDSTSDMKLDAVQ